MDSKKKNIIINRARRLAFPLIIILLLFISSCRNNTHIHEYGEWIIITEASCQSSGLQERYCSCGEKQSLTTGIKEHTLGNSTILSESTCTENGTLITKCTSCNGIILTEEIPAKGHSMSEWNVDVKSTCTSTGKSYRTCSKCNFLEERNDAKLDHECEWQTAVSATCQNSGVMESVCKLCNTIIEKKEIAPVNHNYSNATCTEAATCSYCGTTNGLPLGHDYKNGYCSRCKSTIADTCTLNYSISASQLYSNLTDCTGSTYISKIDQIEIISYKYYSQSNGLVTLQVTVKCHIILHSLGKSAFCYATLNNLSDKYKVRVTFNGENDCASTTTITFKDLSVGDYKLIISEGNERIADYF